MSSDRSRGRFQSPIRGRRSRPESPRRPESPHRRSPYRRQSRKRSRTPPSRARGFTREDAIVLRLDWRQDYSRWTDTLKKLGYDVFDFLQTFRSAASTILRESDTYEVEPLSHHLAEQALAFLGQSFVIEQFQQWWTRNGEPRKVAVCGLLQGVSTERAVSQFRTMGAVIMSTPSWGGDVVISSAPDLENYLKRVSQ
jgi:hypothetical protein